MPNNKKNPKTRMLSVEETNAALEKEFAEQGSQAGDLPTTQGKSEAPDEPLQSSSVVAENRVGWPTLARPKRKLFP